MNVFTTAMSLISAINKNQQVIIRNRVSSFDPSSGVYNESYKEIEASAQVQTNSTRVEAMSDTAPNSYEVYDLWFVNLTPTIINALVSTDILNTEIILANGKKLQVIEKEDYNYNGWIFVKAVWNATA